MWSCATKQNSANYTQDGFLNYTIDINSSADPKMSKYVESIEYLPLIAPDSITLGDIDEILYVGDLIYIKDHSQLQKIFIFDKNGNFHSQIDKHGLSTKEYFNISDFAVDPNNGDVLIFVNSENRAVKRYNTQAEFVESVPYGHYMTDFIAIGGDTVIQYNIAWHPSDDAAQQDDPTKFALITTNRGEVMNKFGEYEHIEGLNRISPPLATFCSHKDSLSLVDNISNTIYRIIDNNSVVPKYRIVIEGKQNPISNLFTASKSELDAYLQQYAKDRRVFANIYSVVENGGVIYLKYSADGLFRTAIINKENHGVYNINKNWVNDIDSIGAAPNLLVSTSQTEMLGYYDASILMQMVEGSNKSSRRIKKVYQTVENMNPVLVRVKFKSDF